MAEGFGNETPENTGYALFAKDLVNFVMLRKSPAYTAQRKIEPISPLVYNETIYDKFSDFLRNHELVNKDYTIDLLSQVAMNPSGYTKTANIIEKKLLDKGFTDNGFINYCVHISTIAALFYNEGEICAPEIAKSHIINVLKYRMPSYGWINVRKIVENFPNVQSSESTESNV